MSKKIITIVIIFNLLCLCNIYYVVNTDYTKKTEYKKITLDYCEEKIVGCLDSHLYKPNCYLHFNKCFEVAKMLDEGRQKN